MRCLRRSAPLLAAAAALLGSAALAGPASADTYSCTNADQTATAPAGAQSAQIDIIGAAGGNSASASGGNAAEVQATIAVTPGEQFTVVVGCQGTLTAGGYGGGGPFGQSNTGSSADNGAGGGGATAILPAGDDNFADAYAVAGGGGGGAGGQYTGGGTGGNADSDGSGGGADYTTTGGFFPGGFGGQSGDSGGGAGTTYGQQQGTYIDYTGYNYGYPGSDGTNGSAGPGGAGGASNTSHSSNDAGGGGGGGITGGGGGGGGIQSGSSRSQYPSSTGGGGGGGSSGVQHGAQIGSTTFAGSGNGSATITYSIQRATSTSIGCSGAIELSQTTACTASVSDTDAATATTPTGSVSFTSASGSFSGGGSCALTPSGTAGVSSCQVTYSPPSGAASETLTAAYGGDGTHAPSSGQTTLVVGLRDSSTSVECSSSPAEVGQTATCVTTVSDPSSGTASSPTGNVSFSSDSGASFSGGDSCALTPSSTTGVSRCQITDTPRAVGTGPDTITAGYAGDATHSSSSGQTTQSVVPRASSITVACSGSPVVVGHASMCTASISDIDAGFASSPTGKVSFTSNSSGSFGDGGSCTLAATSTSGAASCQVTYTPTTVGSDTHTISVEYGGDAIHASSHGNTTLPVVPGTLAIATRGRSSRSGAKLDPAVKLSCRSGGPACTVTEQVSTLLGTADTPIGSARGPQGSVTIGTARFSIPAGGSVEGILTLDQLGQMLVGDHAQLPVQVAISGRVGSGPLTSAAKHIVLAGGRARYAVDSIYLSRNGTLTLRIKVTSPGQVMVLMTAWKNNMATMARVLSPAPRRMVYGRATATATRPGTLTIHVMPNRAGRRLLARPAYRMTLRVWASYIPLYAYQTDTGYYGLHPGGACAGCQRRVWP